MQDKIKIESHVEMSSVNRGHIEIPSRVQFLFAVGSAAYYSLVSGKLASAVMTAEEFAAAFEQQGTEASVIYRDMGKEVNIVNATGQRLATFRLVQRMQGATTEGVGGDAPEYNTYYICTWTADNAVYSMNVVRAG